MSIHIQASKGQIAPTVLLPGDPLRARYFAETLLEDPQCFNQIRGMYGYTGRYQGKPVSVMGTGMGIPSLSIYVSELIMEYQVKTLIRVGTCGGFQGDLEIGDIILAMAASTDSHINRLRFEGMDFAPTASFGLLLKAYQAASSLGVKVHVGSVFTSDTFYNDDPKSWEKWADYGALAVEMETAGLYTLAAKHHVQALALLTVGDNILTGQEASAKQREKGFSEMARIALEIVE